MRRRHRFSLVSVFLIFGRFYHNEVHCGLTSPLSLTTISKTPVSPSVGLPSSRNSSLRFPTVTKRNATPSTNGHARSVGTTGPLRLSASLGKHQPARRQDDIDDSKTGNGLAAANFVYSQDNLQQEDRVTHDIYAITLFLLLRKIHIWLDSGDDHLDAIKYYLGYGQETVSLINAAMAELYFAKHRAIKYRNMYSLESLFYYSCDVERTRQQVDTVRENLRKFIDLFGVEKQTVFKRNESELRTDLSTSLRQSSSRPTNVSFNVSIESMKMTVLSDLSKDKTMDPVKDRSVLVDSSGTRKSMKELVESYATETDGDKVIANHVNVLSALIPDVFGYALNHFRLLYRLRDFEIDENDKRIIEQFSTFVSSFVSIFIDRFFEFKGEASPELMNAINSVWSFLDPSKPYTAYGRVFSDEERSIMHESDYEQVVGENVSIVNYYEKSERAEVIDNYMKVIMEEAVKTLLDTCTEDPLQTWDVTRFSKMDDLPKPVDKNALIELIEENKKNAFNILDAFNRELGNSNQ